MAVFIETPQISDAWIAERWPDEDASVVRRRFNALMDRLGESSWRGFPAYPEVMVPVLAWAALLPDDRINLLSAALANVPDYLLGNLWQAEKPAFGEQRVKYEAVCADSGHGMGRQAIASTPYIKGYNLAPWIAAASPGNVAALLSELQRLGARVTELLAYNNVQVEKRRGATDLLQHVLEEWDDEGKYNDLYHSIETFLSEIHS